MPAIRSSIDFNQVAGHAGAAADDLFSAVGSYQAAGSYRTSAKYSDQNARLEQEGLDIQQAQIQRQLYKVVGGQQADVASAGFASSGSALDLLRDSQTQGALQRAQTNVQGRIQIESSKGQAEASRQQAEASDTAGLGNIIGTALEVGAAILPFLLLL